MAKKQTTNNPTPENENKSSRSIISIIITAVIFIVAMIASEITGIDFVSILNPGPTPTATSAPVIIATDVPFSRDVNILTLEQGYGAEKGFWQVYFTAPTGSRDSSVYVGGVDTVVAAAIDNVRGTLDIAAFEFNNRTITDAVLNAHRRGVVVRMVTDNDYGLNDDDATISELIEAGIPVVDDARSALMHNKFMIMDGSVVWTGSMNYTVNGSYRNNNNVLQLRSRRAVETYQSEFNEMFVDRQFGPRSPSDNRGNFNQNGTPVEIYFAPEDDVLNAINSKINNARSSIHFMTFAFTEASVRDAMLARSNAGVEIQGIFERVGSGTEYSALTPLFCAGLQVRQDGNPFVLHHKVIIVDREIVITGSFNFSQNATRSNDENLVIIQDADLAAQYLNEYSRRWAEAITPENITCS